MAMRKILLSFRFICWCALFGIVFTSLISCSPIPEQEITSSPLPDLDSVSTSAVKTFQAQLTTTSLAEEPAPFPTATPTPPPAVSTTPSPSQTALVVDTNIYRAELVSQYPPDRTDIVIGEHFDMVWTIRNMGTEVWNESYKLRFVEGWPLGKYATVNLDRLVYPNEDVDILVDMVAPPRPETAVSYWQLVNDRGETFYTVSIRINAILRPTATKTPK